MRRKLVALHFLRLVLALKGRKRLGYIFVYSMLLLPVGDLREALATFGGKLYNSSLYDGVGCFDEVDDGGNSITEVRIKRRVEVEYGVELVRVGFSVSVEHTLVRDVVVDAVLIKVSKESRGMPVFTMS